MNLLRWVTWVAAAACLLGCGPRSGLERVYLSGQVLLDESPLEVGQIRFIPEPGTNGPVTIERFQDGRYETETTGGVPVGKHRVEILAYRKQDYDNWPRGPGSPPIPQLVPDQFNTKSTLTIELRSGAGTDVHDFHLKH